MNSFEKGFLGNFVFGIGATKPIMSDCLILGGHVVR